MRRNDYLQGRCILIDIPYWRNTTNGHILYHRSIQDRLNNVIKTLKIVENLERFFVRIMEDQ